MPRFFPKLTATPLQTAAYFLGIALFSISFLVFLNSSQSFVIIDVIKKRKDIGRDIGTLGFADELLALVACPLWGVLSDRIGVRSVATLGYCIVGFSLICFVQSTNVYPELLVSRLGFSLGGAACTTMVTAVLPAMVAQRVWRGDDEESGSIGTNGHADGFRDEERDSRRGSVGHAATASVSSEHTMTQHLYTTASRSRRRGAASPRTAKEDVNDVSVGTSQLAGLTGMFTGAGALVALALFLPLPTRFQDGGQDEAQSIKSSFYVVGAIAFCVALFVFFGLRHLPGEHDKSVSALWTRPYDESTKTDAEGNVHIILTPAPSYFSLVSEAVRLGFTDRSISLGYVGGFVARSSSVAISAFIPLFVKYYFEQNGLCTIDPNDPTDIKESCKRAYTLAAALTGIAETAALIGAPLFGWAGAQVAKGQSEWPLLFAAAVGVGGYLTFGFLKNPDAFHGEGGSWSILAVVLIGISQIGSIVCSLALLGRGINHIAPEDPTPQRPTTSGPLRQEAVRPESPIEAAPLLPPATSSARPSHPTARDRQHLKGTIAGVYSFLGGAGILILTKAGGALFDSWTPGAPFFLMAMFNAALLAAVAVIGGATVVRAKRERVKGIARDD